MILKNITYIVILTTVAVIAFIAYTVFHNTNTSTIEENTALKITPIPESFDSSVITELKQRTVINPNLNGKISFSSTSSTASGNTNQTIEENSQ